MTVIWGQIKSLTEDLLFTVTAPTMAALGATNTPDDILAYWWREKQNPWWVESMDMVINNTEWYHNQFNMVEGFLND